MLEKRDFGCVAISILGAAPKGTQVRYCGLTQPWAKSGFALRAGASADPDSSFQPEISPCAVRNKTCFSLCLGASVVNTESLCPEAFLVVLPNGLQLCGAGHGRNLNLVGLA